MLRKWESFWCPLPAPLYENRVKLGYYGDSFMQYKVRGPLSATGPSSTYFNWRSLQFVTKQALTNYTVSAPFAFLLSPFASSNPLLKSQPKSFPSQKIQSLQSPINHSLPTANTESSLHKPLQTGFLRTMSIPATAGTLWQILDDVATARKWDLNDYTHDFVGSNQ